MSECGAEAWTGAVNRTLHTCEVTGAHDTHDDGHGFRWSTNATVDITDVPLIPPRAVRNICSK
jgi:hypothetical protein